MDLKNRLLYKCQFWPNKKKKKKNHLAITYEYY